MYTMFDMVEDLVACVNEWHFTDTTMHYHHKIKQYQKRYAELREKEGSDEGLPFCEQEELSNREDYDQIVRVPDRTPVGNHLYLRPWQDDCFNAVVHQRHVRINAPTGSGKSKAAVLARRRSWQVQLRNIMNIRTNYNWRHFEYQSEVPLEVLMDQFDYQFPDDVVTAVSTAIKAGADEDTALRLFYALIAENEDVPIDGYFRYKGIWYHLDQFMRVPEGMFDGEWNGYMNDSAFSGVLINTSDDGEEYQVAIFTS